MKNTILLMLICLLCMSCAGSEDSQNDDSRVQELALREPAAGNISKAGEVDWYHYRVVQANAMLSVKCSSNTYRSDVTLLATVYTLNQDGEKVRLYADHAPENSQLPADIKMNIFVDVPKDIYISVRDLMDDDWSDNPYYLSIDFAEAGDDNGNFFLATAIGVNDPDSCGDDTIGYIGDVDCFGFSAAEDGIYDVHMRFSPFAGGTDVELSIDLYDGQGALVSALNRTQRRNYHMVSYLDAGDYYLMVDDFGKDDFDTASSYSVCVSTVESDEIMANDIRPDASAMAYDSLTQTFSAEGSLDYIEDQDWFYLPLQDVDTAGFKILKVQFDDLDPDVQFSYQLELEDEGQNIKLAHTFTGGSVAYATQIRAGTGDHRLLVQPLAGQHLTHKAPYQLSVQVLDIDDPAETLERLDADSGEILIGNDSIENALQLTPTADIDAGTIGKISFRGDEDWYALVIPDAATPHILELFLDTASQASMVEYCVSFIRDGVIKKLVDTNGADGGTDLQGSIFVPAVQTSGNLTYYFKVSDYQGDDGDGQVPYNLRANLLDIPGVLPEDPLLSTDPVTYLSETVEREQNDSETIYLEISSLTQHIYSADKNRLAFNGIAPAPETVITENADQTRTIVFPWIGGYVDYQGDQDFYAVDLGPWLENGVALDSHWYYDIQVELHTDSRATDVEYVWKLYRDINGNRILVDRPQDSDGFFASAGDTDLALQPLDMLTPETGDATPFWVGDAWEGTFYLSISDFNFVGSNNPDDDWGYDGSPYYIRLKLVYHPGQSYP